MKKLCLFLCVLLTLALFGCEKAPAEQTVLTTMPPTISLPETTTPFETTLPTTLPSETTAPSETTPPQYEPKMEVSYYLITDSIAELPNDSDRPVVTESDADTYSLASIHYIRFFTNCSTSRSAPYENGVFWVNREGQEYNSQNHFDCYVLENGNISKLNNIRISQTYSAFGGQLPLELEYAIHNDHIYLTYQVVPGALEACVSVQDISMGIHECLVKLHYVKKTETGFSYSETFDLLDLATGKLQNYLRGFDESHFLDCGNEREFIAFTADGSIVFRWPNTKNQYGLFDMSTKTVIEKYDYQAPAAPAKNIYSVIQGQLQVRNTATEELYFVGLPTEFDLSAYKRQASPSGSKLMGFYCNGTTNLFVYDADAKQIIEILLDLPEDVDLYSAYWASENEIAVVSQNLKDYAIITLAVQTPPQN